MAAGALWCSVALAATRVPARYHQEPDRYLPIEDREEIEAAARARQPLTAIVEIKRDGGQLKLRAWVPKEVRLLTLESRPRAQRGAWMPRAIKHRDGSEGFETFSIEIRAGELELFRVKADPAGAPGIRGQRRPSPTATIAER
ncbi:MAG: hypothetical protein HC814_08605, partial [Rhodobacteraceae bacterium]|nr:hypothetical protein [Paracoccaceae bacterium]